MVPKDLLPAPPPSPFSAHLFPSSDYTVGTSLSCWEGEGGGPQEIRDQVGILKSRAARSSHGVSLKFRKRENNPAPLPLGSNNILPQEPPYSHCEVSLLGCPQFTQA